MGSIVNTQDSRPLLLVTSFPGDGHTGPLLRVAAGLVQRGWDVAYLAASQYEPKIRAIGAEFFEAPDPFTPAKFAELGSQRDIPVGPRRYAHTIGCVFLDDLPARTERLQETLEALRARDPGRQIVVVEDGPNMASVPWRYGRPLPRGFGEFPRTLGVSPCPLIMQSVDCAPTPLGLPPDTSDSGRLRNAALNQLINDGPFKKLHEKRDAIFRSLGCTSLPTHTVNDIFFVDYDQTLLLCSPSLEYDLSDKPSTVGFAGCLPRPPLGKDLAYPPWWAEVTNKGESGKKVVFVTQGTVNTDPEDLILPTVQGLADRDDVLVIVVLGSRGATLDVSRLPANARVLDYFPYNAVLAHSDVFVSNAGYGGFTHAVVNGVPAVFAGQTEEKAEVAERGSVAGFAVNLRTQTPSAAAVRGAVDKVLADGRYKRRALELMAENEGMDSLGVIEERILWMIK
ncbi:UDP-glucosyltransferase A1 [Colletotrichum siamense]|uniref:UDP-glucosyltransferase A1 n=1 Tax=Colletotrichum siamense TaxID=690259 RepID=A0A9P5KAK7_COLSI|nr:UDP-glucosyltransferase A1 [Colletotrichum siamense]KAF4866831.1 UDP-glucosyltransferase A1 [Colletotrichum siamense]